MSEEFEFVTTYRGLPVDSWIVDNDEDDVREAFRAGVDIALTTDTQPAAATSVVNYGEPEPDRSKVFTDKDGDTWRYGIAVAGWYFQNAAYEWDQIDYVFFPFTEVVR